MKFLLDTTSHKIPTDDPLVGGQLCTPLSRRKNWGGTFAIDNGAFAGFDRDAFFRELKKHEPYRDKCLFVAVPDIVGNARRTLELYFQITQFEEMKPWTRQWSMVLQDGIEDLPIPWYAVNHIFVGGTNGFKDSATAYDVVRTARALGVPVHCGRVNTLKRYLMYRGLGAATCDGTGVAKYDHMMATIRTKLARPAVADTAGLFDDHAILQ